jgi:hypothetical protein
MKLFHLQAPTQERFGSNRILAVHRTQAATDAAAKPLKATDPPESATIPR